MGTVHSVSCSAIVLVVTIMCFTGAVPVFGRGAVPPPPPLVGLGSSGEWLGSGPIFGFDDPLGQDFYPGGSGSGGGTNGFEFDPTSGSGGSGSTSNNCITCKCYRWVESKRDCDPTCACELSVRSPVRGKSYKGYCATAVRQRDAGYGCCQYTQACYGIYP